MNERELNDLVDEHHRAGDEFDEAFVADDLGAMQAALDLMSEIRKRCHAQLKADKSHGASLIQHGIRLDCMAGRIALLTRRVDKISEAK